MNSAVATMSQFETNLDNIYEKKAFRYKHIHFLLCESCYWCTSYLKSNKISIYKCPSCHKTAMKWMPLSAADIYKLDYNSIDFLISRSIMPTNIKPDSNGPKQAVSET